MAKSKLSELTAATQVNKADAMYLVQSGVSKQVTTSTLFAGITDPTIKGNIVLGGAPQDMTSAGAVNITTPITYLGVGSSQSTISIPNGANGQVKVLLTTSTANGSFTLNTNVANSANIIFSNVGDTATLLYTNNKWFMIGGTAPQIIRPDTALAITTTTATTANLANAATATFNLIGGNAYVLYKIQTSSAAWVRIYTSSAARSADANRAQGQDPAVTSGVIAEAITAGAETVAFSPAVNGFNNETVATNTMPVAVTNLANTNVAITVTVTKMTMVA